MSPSPSSVTLARLTPAHAAAMVRWLSDAAVASNLGLRTQPTLERTEAFIASASNDDVSCARAIVLDDQHVGTVVLDQFDRRVGKARFHIYVGEPSARGRNVGKRATALALDVAFGELGLHKVWLTVHVRNVAAINAYEASGFVIEGTHREEFLLGSELIDEHYMGVLAPPRLV